ncbi:MAG: response regulator PleD [Rickettsiaceae bacterium]|jgi:PAS domain S-box-containing protein|nr:response regulator PleD [Rickettsiaceae bacterium]
MKATISAKRKGDALITLCQNNTEKRLEIEKMNLAAEKLTGYPSGELIGKNLELVLPDRVRETVSEYVDFTEEAGDFASVARKIPNFQILNKSGREIPVSLKVFYLISETHDKLEYELLMRDITLIKRMEELKDTLAANSDLGAVDDQIDIPSEAALGSALQIAHEFIENDPIEVSFAIVAIDNMPAYLAASGEAAVNIMIKDVANEIQKTCRDEDIIGYLGNGQIGLLLLDCNTDNAKSVLGRVKKNILGKGIKLDEKDPKLSLTIAYIQIQADYDMEKLISVSRETVNALQAQGGNVMTEV